MSREARIVLALVGVVVLLFAASEFWGTDLVVVLVPFVYVAMALGILDAAVHRDSTWRAADQNKLVWVLVQLLPVVGTLTYAILVHPGLKAAEKAPGAADGGAPQLQSRS